MPRTKNANSSSSEEAEQKVEAEQKDSGDEGTSKEDTSKEGTSKEGTSKEGASKEGTSKEESGESDGGNSSSKKTASESGESESGESKSGKSNSSGSESDKESDSVSDPKPTKTKRKADSDLKPKDGKKAKMSGSVRSGRKSNRRIWFEEDEIVVLEGFTKYVTKKGKHPYDDMDSFYAFIVKSISFNASKTQLINKVKRFQGKYDTNKKKTQSEREKAFAADPHEREIYDLSKKIWGIKGVLKSCIKSNGVVKKSSNANSTKKGGSGGSSSIIAGVATYLASLGFDEHDSKMAWGLMDESKKAGMKEKWKKLGVAQLKLTLQKGQYINQIGKSMVEVLNR